MLSKFFRLYFAALFSIITIASAALNSAAAADFDLRPPNYGDATDVGRHIAFSIIFATLVRNVYNATPPRGCHLELAATNFPNLQFWLEASAESFKRCNQRMEHLLMSENFDQVSFDTAVKMALRFKPSSLEESRFASSDLAAGAALERLRRLAELAIKQLYPTDPVLMPLLEYYEWLSNESKNYNSFIDWLAMQRSAIHFRFKTPSLPVVPVLSRPNIDYSRGIRVNAPTLRGRSLVLVRCDSIRDRNCTSKATRAFCGKKIDQIITDAGSYSQSQFRCITFGGIINLPGWLAIDSDDANVVRSLYEELSSPRPRASENYSSLIEYVVRVTVE